MTKEEYKLKQQELRVEYETKKKNTATEYAFSNNKVKIGDIITDHISKMEVTSIGLYYSEDDPQCFYRGIHLKKDGTPAKRQEHTIIYQTNLKQ